MFVHWFNLEFFKSSFEQAINLVSMAVILLKSNPISTNLKLYKIESCENSITLLEANRVESTESHKTVGCSVHLLNKTCYLVNSTNRKII